MFRLRPTPIALSDDEIYSCVQRIMVARILERGGDPLVSPLGRRRSSSEGASMNSPYLASDSSGFEEFTDCGPDDCDRSPALSNGKHKREASPGESQIEHPPLSPALQESPPSSTDAQLAEQLDTITLNFTSFLSPSTWLGPFALSSGSVGGNMCQEWGDTIPIALCCQMKPLALPIPTGLSLLQYRGLYSDTSPCSEESNKELSVLGYTIPDPISPESTHCSSPCCRSAPSTPQLSESRDTDSESED
ncbi:hypothetical protein GX50_08244 [[Emmonsia] crescens]|uniref:Uncharacterized protein n=1 Tax=[Emmonsia] crescens TaxID=73230 RepID=A0A2B7Z7L0_9EURO|nr:hypothetical protein GX50_08244 [Emmonsia crescens]